MSSVADESRDGVKLIEIDQGQLQRHADGVVRDAVEQTLNQLLDAEADELCGAKRYERSPDRVDYRAGPYARRFQTKAGEVELKVPKLRRATFESQVIDRYRRRETSVEEALVEMYLAGVSVRRVEDITEALWGTRVSSGTVSRLNQKVASCLGLVVVAWQLPLNQTEATASKCAKETLRHRASRAGSCLFVGKR